MFFVEAGAESSVAAGCVSSAISVLYLKSADAAIPVGTFAGYAVRSWLRHLFCGSANWMNVFLLTLIEMGLFAVAVGAGGIMELMERLCERVEDVLTIYIQEGFDGYSVYERLL